MTPKLQLQPSRQQSLCRPPVSTNTSCCTASSTAVTSAKATLGAISATHSRYVLRSSATMDHSAGGGRSCGGEPGMGTGTRLSTVPHGSSAIWVFQSGPKMPRSESMRTRMAASGRRAFRYGAQKAAPAPPLALEVEDGPVPTASTRTAAGKLLSAHSTARPALMAPKWWTVMQLAVPGA